jgi:hypothetical protein
MPVCLHNSKNIYAEKKAWNQTVQFAMTFYSHPTHLWKLSHVAISCTLLAFRCLFISPQVLFVFSCLHVFKLHGLQVQACVSQRVLFTLFIQSLQWILSRLIPSSEVGQYLMKRLEHRVWGVHGRSSTRANYWIYFQCIAGLHMQPLHMSHLQQVTWRHGCKLPLFSFSCSNSCSNLSSANKH